MSVTTFNAKLRDANGKLFAASISWDKHSPQLLTAAILPMISDIEAGHPVWRATGVYGVAGQRALIAALRTQATKMGAAFVSAGVTEFAPK